MRTLYLTTLTLLLSCGLHAQIIFESDLSDWNNTVPTDWFGARTSLEIDSTLQVTEDVVYGTSLARMTNLESSHKRFTTQALSLEDGQTYEVEVWMKGSGEVRTNLYDGAGGNGYNTYNAYVPVTAELSSFTQTILPDTTSAEQEVIISFRGGVLDVDRVEVRLGMAVDPVEASIYDIQFTEDPSGNSPLMGMPVITSGIVTAVTENGYYIQDGTDLYSGLYVADASNTTAVGDEVSVTGTVEEFFQFTQLINVTDLNVESTGNSITDWPIYEETDVLNDEKYESMLVETEGACVDLPNDFGEWAIQSGPEPILVDDQMYAYTPTLGTPYIVRGPLNYSFDAFKIEPRDQNDVQFPFSITEESTIDVNIYPNPASDILILSSKSFRTGDAVRLTDAFGRTVKQWSINSTMQSFDISDLDPGNYILRIDTEQGIGIRKVSIR